MGRLFDDASPVLTALFWVDFFFRPKTHGDPKKSIALLSFHPRLFASLVGVVRRAVVPFLDFTLRCVVSKLLSLPLKQKIEQMAAPEIEYADMPLLIPFDFPLDGVAQEDAG